MVLGKLSVPRRPTIWMTVGQAPTALAVGAGGGCLDIFSLIYPISILSPSLLETARYSCLVGCFWFNGPLTQYFSLYRVVSQREGERRERIDESNMSKPPPPAPTASAVGPCPTVIQIVGRPGTGSLPSTIAPPYHPPARYRLKYCLKGPLSQKQPTKQIVGCLGTGSLPSTIAPPDYPGRAVRWCWVIFFQCRDVLLIWIRVGQGPSKLAVGADQGCLDNFSLVYHFSFLSPSLCETAQ